MLSYIPSSSFWTLLRVLSEDLCIVSMPCGALYPWQCLYFNFTFRNYITSLSFALQNHDSIAFFYPELMLWNPLLFEVMISYFFLGDCRMFCAMDFINITLTCLAVGVFLSILFGFSYLSSVWIWELRRKYFLINLPAVHTLVNFFLLGLLQNT